MNFARAWPRDAGGGARSSDDIFERIVLPLVLVGAFAFGLVFVFTTPPMGGQDELFHWQRTVQVSQGGLLASRLGDNSWGGPIDKSAYELSLWFLSQFQKLAPIDFAESQRVAHALSLQPRTNSVVPFPSTASFSPLAYLPQSFGIALARLFGGELMAQIYAGRIANLIVYLGLAGLIVRVSPFAKTALLALLLIPHWICLAATLSADPLNAALPLLLAVWCLRLRYVRDTPFSLGAMIALVASLGLLKPIYFLFAPLILLIPQERFSSLRARAIFVVLAAGLCLALGAAWNVAYPFVPGKYWMTGADPQRTVALWLENPARSVWTFYSTVRDWHQIWWFDGYGRFGGHADPFSFYAARSACFAGFWGLVALAAVDAAPRREAAAIALLTVIAVGFSFVLLIAFWVGFTAPSSPTIDGIQGRYFVVPWTLALLALALAAPFGARALALRWPLLAMTLAVHAYVAIWAIARFQTLWR